MLDSDHRTTSADTIAPNKSKIQPSILSRRIITSRRINMKMVDSPERVSFRLAPH